VTGPGSLDASPLGHATTYAEGYDPGLLFAVGARTAGLLRHALLFRKMIWTAYGSAGSTLRESRRSPSRRWQCRRIHRGSSSRNQCSTHGDESDAFRVCRGGDGDAQPRFVGGHGAGVGVTLALQDSSRVELAGYLDALPLART
jgi:hypothetical protein